MFIFKNHTVKEPGRLIPDLFLYALYEVKASG